MTLNAKHVEGTATWASARKHSSRERRRQGQRRRGWAPIRDTQVVAVRRSLWLVQRKPNCVMEEGLPSTIRCVALPSMFRLTGPVLLESIKQLSCGPSFPGWSWEISRHQTNPHTRAQFGDSKQHSAPSQSTWMPHCHLWVTFLDHRHTVRPTVLVFPSLILAAPPKPQPHANRKCRGPLRCPCLRCLMSPWLSAKVGSSRTIFKTEVRSLRRTCI